MGRGKAFFSTDLELRPELYSLSCGFDGWWLGSGMLRPWTRFSFPAFDQQPSFPLVTLGLSWAITPRSGPISMLWLAQSPPLGLVGHLWGKGKRS